MINWGELFNEKGAAKHHAFLVAGEPTAILTSAREFLQTNLKINPAELYEWRAAHFKIDDSRVLKEHLGGAVAGERFMLVGFENILPEAEQALLKILEEPPRGVIFILVCPRPLTLPSTILSRVWLINQGNDNAKTKILAGSPAERLQMVAKEVARTEAGDESIESLVWPALSVAERELASRLSSKSTPETVALGEDLNLIRRLVAHKLAARSPKNLVEYLALIWPRS